MKFEYPLQIFERKTQNIKFHKSPSSRSRVGRYERTNRQTDTTKLIIVFRNFPKAPTYCTHSATNRNKYQALSLAVKRGGA